jgi:hypothetical protein
MWPAVHIYSAVDKEAASTHIFADHICTFHCVDGTFQLAKTTYTYTGKHGVTGPSIAQIIELCKKGVDEDDDTHTDLPCIWHEWLVPRKLHIEQKKRQKHR